MQRYEQRAEEMMRAFRVPTPTGLKFQWLLLHPGWIDRRTQPQFDAFKALSKDLHRGFGTRAAAVAKRIDKSAAGTSKTLLPREPWLRYLKLRLAEVQGLDDSPKIFQPVLSPDKKRMYVATPGGLFFQWMMQNFDRLRKKHGRVFVATFDGALLGYSEPLMESLQAQYLPSGTKVRATLIPPAQWTTLLHAILVERQAERNQRYRKFKQVKLAMSAKNVTQGVRKWTESVYKNIRNARSGSIVPHELLDRSHATGKAASVDEALTTFMRNYSLRAPETPLGTKSPDYLWRGIHGTDAGALRKTGCLNTKSYVATTTDKRVAKGFSGETNYKRVLLQIPPSTIPPGTPWVWFTADNKASSGRGFTSSNIEDNEVLLPPGRIVLLPPVSISAISMYKFLRSVQESQAGMEYVDWDNPRGIKMRIPYRRAAFDRLSPQQKSNAVRLARVVAHIRGKMVHIFTKEPFTDQWESDSRLIIRLVRTLPSDCEIILPLTRVGAVAQVYFQWVGSTHRFSTTFGFPGNIHPALYIPDTSATSLVTKRAIVRSLYPKRNIDTPNNLAWMSPTVRKTWNAMFTSSAPRRASTRAKRPAANAPVASRKARRSLSGKKTSV